MYEFEPAQIPKHSPSVQDCFRLSFFAKMGIVCVLFQPIIISSYLLVCPNVLTNNIIRHFDSQISRKLFSLQVWNLAVVNC